MDAREAFLSHHGILGQKWGHKNGPPYPLSESKHSASEKKAGWRKSLSDGRPSVAKIIKNRRDEKARKDKEVADWQKDRDERKAALSEYKSLQDKRYDNLADYYQFSKYDDQIRDLKSAHDDFMRDFKEYSKKRDELDLGDPGSIKKLDSIREKLDRRWTEFEKKQRELIDKMNPRGDAAPQFYDEYEAFKRTHSKYSYDPDLSKSELER